MKVYLAAPFGMRGEMRLVAEKLAAIGVGHTSQWIYAVGPNVIGTPKGELEALEDYEAVRQCDILLHFSNSAEHKSVGGKNVEQGLAMAWGKPVIHVGPVENIFHHHPRVKVVPRLEEVMEELALSAMTFGR